MGHDNVVRGQVGGHALHHLEQRIIIRYKNLDEIAQLSHFRG